MTNQEIARALTRKSNGRTVHLEPVATMSEATYSLTDLSHIKDVPAVAEVRFTNELQPLFTARGNLFNKLEDAIGRDQLDHWKLAEYYVDNNGLYLVYLPNSDELAQIAQEHLEVIPTCIDDEESARNQIVRSLYAGHNLAVKVTGDFSLYLDYGDKADCIDASINVKGGQSITLRTVDHEHCLRRLTYRQDARKITSTTYYG